MNDGVSRATQMKSRIFLTLGALAVAALSGCASGPTTHRADPAHSKAWNITRAAGYNELKDVDRAKVAQDVDPTNGNLIEGVAGGALGFLSNPNSLPLSGNVGMGLLTGLLLGEDVAKAGGTAVFAWVPKSEVNGRDGALRQFYAQVSPVLISALEGMDLPSPYHWKEIRELDWGERGYNNKIYAILGGGECDSDDYYCRVTVTLPTPTAHNVADAIMPATLGGHPAWLTRVSISYSFTDKSKWSAPYYARLPLLHVLNTVSKSLPSDYYLYIAPGGIPFQQKENEYRFFPAPVVFNQGETLYFIEPKQSS